MEEFTVIIERDEDGYYVAEVVELPGCYTQAKTIEELERRIKEAIEAYLSVKRPVSPPKFIGIHRVSVGEVKTSKAAAIDQTP